MKNSISYLNYGPKYMIMILQLFMRQVFDWHMWFSYFTIIYDYIWMFYKIYYKRKFKYEINHFHLTFRARPTYDLIEYVLYRLNKKTRTCHSNEIKWSHLVINSELVLFMASYLMRNSVFYTRDRIICLNIT